MSILKSIIQSKKLNKRLKALQKNENFLDNGSESLNNSHWHRASHTSNNGPVFTSQTLPIAFSTKSIKKKVLRKKITTTSCTRPASTLFRMYKKAHRDCQYSSLYGSYLCHTRWHIHSRFKFNQYSKFFFCLWNLRTLLNLNFFSFQSFRHAFHVWHKRTNHVFIFICFGRRN